jgi:outer membrane lipoprotein carrier protein
MKSLVHRALAFGAALGLGAMVMIPTAHADALERLRDFSRDVKSAQASFTQTVTSADGQRRKTSSGSFAFQRPSRFRFAYETPFEQLIVADGQKVWIYDADLNQASSRPLTKALGATPAALLAGAAPESEFTFANDGAAEGIEWVKATPKARDASLQSIRVGFRGKELAAVEVMDNFGQRSLLQFDKFAPNVALPAERFRFTPPAGADVVEQ